MSTKTTSLANMPAFPPVAARLLRVTADENAANSELVYLLRADAALSTEIIRYANSPLFTFATEIRTLDQAVPLLGQRKIRSLAIASIGRTYIRAVLMMDELRVFWRYSLACALLSEMIAQFCSVPEDTAYSAGLLHDIGRLGLMVTHPSEYAMLIQTASGKLEAGEPFDLAEYECALFGIDRYSAGEQLAHDWGLPEELRTVSGRFPAPKDEPELDLVGVTRIACRLANSLGFCVLKNPHGPSYLEVLSELPHHVASCFPPEAEDLRARLEEEITALDEDPASGESAPEMQTLLDIGQSASSARVEVSAYEAESNKRNMWPAVIVVLLAVAAIILWFQLRG